MNDPRGAWSDELVLAALGLERILRELDVICDGREASWSYVHDAVLGLMSLRTTLRLVIEAVAERAVDAPAPAPAAWSRELLR